MIFFGKKIFFGLRKLFNYFLTWILYNRISKKYKKKKLKIFYKSKKYFSAKKKIYILFQIIWNIEKINFRGISIFEEGGAQYVVPGIRPHPFVPNWSRKKYIGLYFVFLAVGNRIYIVYRYTFRFCLSVRSYVCEY